MVHAHKSAVKGPSGGFPDRRKRLRRVAVRPGAPALVRTATRQRGSRPVQRAVEPGSVGTRRGVSRGPRTAQPSTFAVSASMSVDLRFPDSLAGSPLPRSPPPLGNEWSQSLENTVIVEGSTSVLGIPGCLSRCSTKSKAPVCSKSSAEWKTSCGTTEWPWCWRIPPGGTPRGRAGWRACSPGGRSASCRCAPTSPPANGRIP